MPAFLALALAVAAAPSAPAAAAHNARTIVRRYYELIAARRYPAARSLWGNNGADTRGTPAQFAESFAPYVVYRATAGEPTRTVVTAGVQYITVPLELRTRRRGDARTIVKSGVVMLKRPEPRRGAGAAAWRIWGIDARERH